MACDVTKDVDNWNLTFIVMFFRTYLDMYSREIVVIKKYPWSCCLNDLCTRNCRSGINTVNGDNQRWINYHITTIDENWNQSINDFISMGIVINWTSLLGVETIKLLLSCIYRESMRQVKIMSIK